MFNRQLIIGMLTTFLATALLPAAHGSSADTWPSSAIKMVVPFVPGGSTDLIARSLADGLRARLSVPVFVENRAGAGGTVGSAFVSKQKPDGYTLLFSTISTHGVAPGVYKNLPYDPLTDFTAVALTATFPQLIGLNPSVPAHNLKEFVALAAQSPDKYTYASNGHGTTNHLAVAMLAERAGVKLMNVPYKGANPALLALISGEVDLMMDVFMTSYPHARQKKIRPLAVTSKHRVPLLPETPTVEEAGFPDFEANIWFGIFAPAGLPPRITRVLNEEINALMMTDKMQNYLKEQGGWFEPTTPSSFKDMVERDVRQWKIISNNAGISLD